MDIVFSPVQLRFSAAQAAHLKNELPWPIELTSSLECGSEASPGQLKIWPTLLDARALTAQQEADWLSCYPESWVVAETPWSLLGALPFTGAARLNPTGPLTRRRWQASASCWLTDWLNAQGFIGDARVGWPVPAHSLLIQLLKADILDVLSQTEELNQAEGNPLIGWEPGAVLLKWADVVCGVPTLGLNKDVSMYVAQQCIERHTDSSTP